MIQLPLLEPAPPRTPLQVMPLPHELAAPFIRRFHYAHACPSGRNWFYGGWLEETLYVVAAYGAGANMDGGRSLAAMTGLPVTRDNHVTLTRLCRRGGKGESVIPLSMFLARCHRHLRRAHGIRFIVSYADPTEHGTVVPAPRSTPWQAGGVYAASNFRWLGQVPPERHFVDATGGFVHRRIPYRLMKRRQAQGQAMTMREAQRELGLTAVRMAPKDRFFLDLGG